MSAEVVTVVERRPRFRAMKIDLENPEAIADFTRRPVEIHHRNGERTAYLSGGEILIHNWWLVDGSLGYDLLSPDQFKSVFKQVKA